MKPISEKYLNMTILKTLKDDMSIYDSNNNIQNATIFYTAFGTVISGQSTENDSIKLSELFLSEKKKTIENFGADSFRNDGEIICVKNASILQNNGKVIYNDCLFIHIDSILGFSLCNLEEVKKIF
ncbi:hypothetical protein [Clostridium massiliamazoniense]|uniref:hypothetical protein n=1 Tax=Clostridium massiliamazoniense TaxID=1347366 RepID=UPI0006D7D395|nr:hypothetical protein [Clostridium massiliamazoniense]